MDVYGEAAAKVANTEDPLTRAAHAHEQVTRLAEVSSEMSRIRRESIEALTRDGWSATDIGGKLGLTRSRVSQLLRSGPSPERAVVSPDGGAITVVLGSQPADNQEGGQKHVTSAEAQLAFGILRDALDSWGVASNQEIVPPPGFTDLNRDHLVVMGSPKVLPMVGQVAASDPNLGFGKDEQGRYLLEHRTGTKHRSPQDQGESVDYGYLGRLPRPDGYGTFLWVAGIHAAGTQGAVRYLVDHAAELYAEVKRDRLFSVLVTATHDSEQHHVTDVSPLTKLYTR